MPLPSRNNVLAFLAALTVIAAIAFAALHGNRFSYTLIESKDLVNPLG